MQPSSTALAPSTTRQPASSHSESEARRGETRRDAARRGRGRPGCAPPASCASRQDDGARRRQDAKRKSRQRRAPAHPATRLPTPLAPASRPLLLCRPSPRARGARRGPRRAWQHRLTKHIAVVQLSPLRPRRAMAELVDADVRAAAHSAAAARRAAFATATRDFRATCSLFEQLADVQLPEGCTAEAAAEHAAKVQAAHKARVLPAGRPPPGSERGLFVEPVIFGEPVGFAFCILRRSRTPPQAARAALAAVREKSKDAAMLAVRFCAARAFRAA